MESHRDFLLMGEEAVQLVSQLEIRNASKWSMASLQTYRLPAKVALNEGRAVTQMTEPHKAS